MEALLRLLFAWLGVDDCTADALVALVMLLLFGLVLATYFFVSRAVTSWYERVCVLHGDLPALVLPGSFPASPPLPRRVRRAFEQAARRRSSSPVPPPPILEHDAAWHIMSRWGPPYSWQSAPVVRSPPVPVGRYDTFLDEATEAHFASAKRVQGPDGNWRWVSFSPEERKARLEFLAERREGKAPMRSFSPQVVESVQVESVDVKKRSPSPPPSGASHEVLNDVDTAAPLVARVEPLQNHSAPPQWPILAPLVGAPNASSVVEESARPHFFDQYRQVCDEKKAARIDFFEQFGFRCRAALVVQRMFAASVGPVAPVVTVPVVAVAPTPQVGLPAPVLPLSLAQSAPVAIAPPPVVVSAPAVVPAPTPVPPPAQVFAFGSTPAIAPSPSPAPGSLFGFNASSIPSTPTPAQRRGRPGARPAVRRPALPPAAPVVVPFETIDWEHAPETELLALRKEKFGWTDRDVFGFGIGEQEDTTIAPLATGDTLSTIEASLDKVMLLRITAVMVRMQLMATSRSNKDSELVRMLINLLAGASTLVSDFTADPGRKAKFYSSTKIADFARAFKFFKREVYDKYESKMEIWYPRSVWDGMENEVRRADLLFRSFR